MTDRPFVKISWTTGSRNDGVWLCEATKATGDGESGSIDFGPFKDHGEALAFAGARQRGLAEMMARMRAQMTLAMRGEMAA